METQQLVEKTTELLRLARERVEMPRRFRELRYFDEVDLLVVEFSTASATHSKGDIENGIIYNYDESDDLTSIEILDLYGIYAEA
jgi:uncharacterized protein YkuJ